jgi:hypothetical protein
MPVVLKAVQIHFLVVELLAATHKVVTLHTTIRVIQPQAQAVPELTSTDIEGQMADRACV